MLEFVMPETTPMVDSLLGWFAETTLAASALAAVAALVAKVRPLTPGPAARHVLWLMVMIKLVTPPLVHWPWSIPSPVATTRSESPKPRDRPIRPVAEVRPHETAVNSGPERDHDPLGIAELPARVGAGLKPTAETLSLALDQNVIRPSLALGTWVAMAWIFGSLAIVIKQGRSVYRFRRLLREATPAPLWLVEEAERIGLRLGVRVPAILSVPGLGTPVLWCLGRPVLLVPTKLLQTLEAGRWRSIVAHELAHLRRGDHWVRRLELAAGLAWWWNPLYWLARSRLDFEAELACDAWAVWASPSDRLTYAESLIRICATLSPTGSPAPALGVAGTGRSFERRLTMILQNRVDRRISAPGLLAAFFLAALALPSWTLAGSPRAEVAPPAVTMSNLDLAISVIVDDDDDATAAAANDDKAKEKAAKLKAERELLKKKDDLDKDLEAKFGPDSDFAKQMEALGKEMEKKFGPDSVFVKKMEAMGREMEAKFGPDSDFAKKMEANFGPASVFAKEMAEAMRIGKSDEAKAESKRDKAKAEGAKAKAEAGRVKSEEAKARAELAQSNLKGAGKPKVNVRVKAMPSPDKRARRIEILEARIEEMTAELKKLKAESKPDSEDQDEDEDDQG